MTASAGGVPVFLRPDAVARQEHRLSPTPVRACKRNGRAKLFKSFAPLVNERLILPAVCQHDPHDSIDQRDVGARPLFQMKRGKFRDIDPAGIRDNQRNSPLKDRLSEFCSEHRMLLGCVRSDYKEGLSITSHILHGVAHCSGTEAKRKTGDG